MKNTKKKNGAAAKGKGRAALSAQQTIPYLSMHPDGVCKLPGGLYTKTVEYEDINYSVASTEDQTAIFSGWSSFLNYFDSSLPFQLSFINRRSHSRSRYQVNIPKADDNYNSVRDEFTGMLKNQIAKSNNGIERSKYITFIDDGYAERLLAKQMESKVEKAVSLVAENYYIQGQIRGIMEEWQGISIEEISKWENYAALRNQSEPDYKTLGTIWVYLDATTMTGTTDEEEYKMYEEVFQKEMGGQALFYVYYLDKKNFQQAEKILEVRAPGDEGSSFEEIIENQPYFGTIMRSNSKTFDDSLEVFKAAKRGEEQEIFQ